MALNFESDIMQPLGSIQLTHEKERLGRVFRPHLNFSGSHLGIIFRMFSSAAQDARSRLGAIASIASSLFRTSIPVL
jgi:hypothetical protein